MSNIVWIDLETGGVNDDKIKLKNPIVMQNGKKIEHISGSQYYPILEIGIIITDNDLNVIDQYQAEIKQSKLALEQMNDWCIAQHEKTGLTQRSLNSTKTIEQVEKECIEFLSKHDLAKRVPMAGSSIHFDHEFITHQMGDLAAKFSHQHIDVTSLHNLYKVKYPELAQKVRDLKSEVSHLVIDDIKDSIKIAKIYSSVMKKDDLKLEDLSSTAEEIGTATDFLLNKEKGERKKSKLKKR